MSCYRPKYRDKETGEWKESSLYWCDFRFAGKRITENTHATRLTVAREYEKNRKRELERIAAGLPPQEKPVEERIMRVSDLIDSKTTDQEATRAAKTASIAKDRGRHVKRIMGRLMRSDVNRGAVVAYILQRKQEGASARSINMETALLASAMGSTRLRLWGKGLTQTERDDAGRALSVDEQAAVVEAARRNRSRFIHPMVLMGLRAAMRSDEMKNLRLSDLDFASGQITIRKSKTDAGKRTVPMTADLRIAVEAYLGWYAREMVKQSKGPLKPDAYLFPMSRSGRPVDPSRPLLSPKTAWETVKKAAKVECRFHDLRHTAITTMLEKGVPETTVKDLVGHVAQRVILRYSHPRAEAKRAAVSFLVPQVLPQVKEDGETDTAVSV